jgi:hypothetical protein
MRVKGGRRLRQYRKANQALQPLHATFPRDLNAASAICAVALAGKSIAVLSSVGAVAEVE